MTALRGRRVWCSEAVAGTRKIKWRGRHRARYNIQEDKREKKSRATPINSVVRLVTLLRCFIGSTLLNPRKFNDATGYNVGEF
jgi:hypothetical protein